MMDNIFLSYEKTDAGDFRTVVHTNKFKKKTNPTPNPHIYFSFKTRDQIYSFETEIPQRNFSSDESGGIQEPSHLTERAGPSDNFGLHIDDLSKNQLRSANVTDIWEQRDSMRSISTTYDRIEHTSLHVDIGRNRTVIKNLKSSRCSYVRTFGVFIVLFLLAIGVALIYLFVIKKDNSHGHDEYEVPVAFEKSSYAFKIGYEATLACHFENIQEWRSIEIASDGERVVALNATELQILPRSNLVQNESFLTNNSGRIVVIFDPVQCNDSPEAAVGEFEYTCAVRTDEDTLEAKTLVTFQSNQGTPVLTLSREIIENKFTLRDRLFTCEGELGYPPATLEVQSDFTGAFETLLSPSTGLKNDNLVWIVSEMTEKSGCKNYRTIEFAFYNITIDMHRKHLRCVLRPADGQKKAIYDENRLYVVPADFCVGKSGHVLHPYLCHLLVQCNVDINGKIDGVPSGCNDDMCYIDVWRCVTCSTVGGCNKTVNL